MEETKNYQLEYEKLENSVDVLSEDLRHVLNTMAIFVNSDCGNTDVLTAFWNDLRCIHEFMCDSIGKKVYTEKEETTEHTYTDGEDAYDTYEDYEDYEDFTDYTEE